MIVFLQRSGWRQSQSREEGQRWVWVCLGNEHSHLVLLSHPGERCVCLCHCNAFIFPVTLWSPQLLTSCHWEHSRCVWGVGSWLMAVCWCCMFLCVCPPGSRSLSSVASLESPVISCLGPLIQYLQEFNLERVLRSERYMKTNIQQHSLRLYSSIVSTEQTKIFRF